MTRIRANCPECGEVDLRPYDIELEVVRDAEGEIGAGSAYRFVCPDCSDLVSKPADARIARLLATGGVPMVVTEGPDGPDDTGGPAAAHPERPPAGPAFTYGDLTTFHALLEGDDWFSHLEAA